MYTPDNWVIVKVILDGQVDYRVLAGWSGGYLDGDSWRMNSGITKIEIDGDYFLVHGQTGSVYKLHREANTVRNNISGILQQLVVEYVAEEVDINDVMTAVNHHDD